MIIPRELADEIRARHPNSCNRVAEIRREIRALNERLPDLQKQSEQARLRRGASFGGRRGSGSSSEENA